MNRIKKKVQKWRAHKETKKQNRKAMNNYKMKTHRSGNDEQHMFSFNKNTIKNYKNEQKKKRQTNTRPRQPPTKFTTNTTPPTKFTITKSNLHKDRARPKFVKELWPGPRRNTKSIKSTRHRSTNL